MTEVGATHERGVSIPVQRQAIGIWTESDGRWRNEGMTRLLGFLIEGIAQAGHYEFHIVVPRRCYEEVLEDCCSLDAQVGRDFFVHAPTENTKDPLLLKASLVRLARSLPNIKSWISLFPYYTGVGELDAPFSVIFPDAILFDFPVFDEENWLANGFYSRWILNTGEMVSTSQNVITFSDHIARRHVQRFFGAPRSKVRVIPVAPPDLAPLLPFVQGRQRTEESIGRAAAMLRAHALERDIGYFSRFPFEEEQFIMISTQDRESKNLVRAGDAVKRLIREEHYNIKMIMTARIHRDRADLLLPKLIDDANLHFDVLSLWDLPREVHAALYHCAAVAVHTSFIEGGRGVFPFYEAVSVGTPCLMARGPHVEELLLVEPSLADFVFESDDSRTLMELIRRTIERRDEALRCQMEAFDRLRRRTWGDVAKEYVSAALASAPEGISGLPAAVSCETIV